MADPVDEDEPWSKEELRQWWLWWWFQWSDEQWLWFFTQKVEEEVQWRGADPEEIFRMVRLWVLAQEEEVKLGRLGCWAWLRWALPWILAMAAPVAQWAGEPPLLCWVLIVVAMWWRW